MANFFNPTLTSNYSDFLAELKARDTDIVQWLDSSTVTATGLPTGAKRWNSTNKYWEVYNGSAWNQLATKYMIDVDKVDGCTVLDTATDISSLWTASKITSALNLKLNTSTYTASDVLAKLLTVDGSGSGLDANLLDGQTGTYYNTGNNLVWATTPTAGKFDTSTTTPVATNRLNYGGYFYPTWLNLAGSVDTTTGASHYYVETSSDGFVRPKALANVRTEIVTKGAVEAVLTGAITSHTHADTTTLTSLGITATSAELNFVDGVTSSIQTQLNTKAPLVSPVLSGTPTAPTAAAGTNNTVLATTAFVLANSIQDNQFTQSLSLNGYQKLPSGLIIQWGTLTANDNTTVTVILPITFTTFCRPTISLQDLVNGGANVATVSVRPNGLAQLTVKTEIGYSGFAPIATWIAIGY